MKHSIGTKWLTKLKKSATLSIAWCGLTLIGIQPALAASELDDLNFIHHAIIENHPGVYNQDDPNFKANLEQFYTTAKQELSKIKADNLSAQESVINQFIQQFDDPHLHINWYEDQPKTSVENQAQTLSLNKLANNIIWLSLPTFELNQYQRDEFESLNQELSHYRSSPAIIFDIRGNGGGNSRYGKKLLSSLFGQDYVDNALCQADLRQKIYVDWRASFTNLKRLELTATKYPDLTAITCGMKNSMLESKPYYRDDEQQTCIVKTPLKPLTNAKIIVLIDKYNYSAALDFIDYVKIVAPSSILLGQTTGADRLYMDVNYLKLPSGLGSLMYPMKVYRNRLRADKQPYQPDIELDTTNKSNAQLQKIIMPLINQ